MYLILTDRNKQYFFKKDNTIKIDFINQKVGFILEFNVIFFNNNSINHKKLIKFKIIKQIKNKKFHVIKFKRRKNYMKKIGCRQKYTIIQMI